MNVASVLFVAAGGAVGAVLRYLATTFMHGWLGRGFPWGTLSVNVVGSLLMGVCFVWLSEHGSAQRAADARLWLMTGVLGGFTTYSAFSLETLALLEAGLPYRALYNVAASVAGCLAAVAAGMWLARQL
jgi:CrcB protein